MDINRQEYFDAWLWGQIWGPWIGIGIFAVIGIIIAIAKIASQDIPEPDKNEAPECPETKKLIERLTEKA